MTPLRPQQCASPLDPEKAIWEKDIGELRRALEAGWTLPYIQAKHAGMVEDLSLVIRTVSLRWVEGWKALADQFPELRQNPTLRALAIRQAVSGIVEDLMAHGMDPSVPIEIEASPLPLHLLQEAMAPRAGEPVYEDDILATAKVLIEGGANPVLPYEGDFSHGDALPAGHCFWSRALFFRNWKIAREFLPESWEMLSSHPRGREMLGDVRKVYESGRVLGAKQMWTDLMNRWIGPWLESCPEEWFALPKDLEIILELSSDARALVWERWNKVDDLEWTGLHELAISAKNPLASQVLALALEDKAPCLRHWSRPDMEGMRPCDLWEIANSKAPSREGVSIQEVLPGSPG